jgi:hypothetical protein
MIRLNNDGNGHFRPCEVSTSKWQRHHTGRPQPCLAVRYSLLTIWATFLLTTQLMATHAEDVDWDLNGENNPDNKYCGLSYEEAHDFCHLPPKQSLPCPNGEEECPYGMPCWEITEECTQPPTLAPTDRPTRSPVTAISDDPTDHFFCGLGFDQLYDW